MKTLTLEQVKKAGRFAAIGWGDSSPCFSQADAWWFTEEGTIFSEAWSPGSTKEVPFESAPTSGWHHLDGCDCEFCGS